MTRTDDGAGSAEPNPPNHLTGGDSVYTEYIAYVVDILYASYIYV